jgi:SSS family solute:Na+ symporter
MKMQWADWLIVAAYAIILPLLGYRVARRLGDSEDYLLAGRTLTLPAFVMTLVTTWYGGILGVGEYTYRYGIANWFVFGLPYYVAALLFAFFLASKAREKAYINLPDQLADVYGPRVARAGAFVVFVAALPAAYVLMLGVLVGILFGWSLTFSVILGTALSTVYVYSGGFRSVLKTDGIQFALMYTGFAVLVAVMWWREGSPLSLWPRLPASHTQITGGQGWDDILVWYFIALATLIEPAFYQRCYAARTGRIARRGILVSVGFWLLFDLLTTASGLYAAALYKNLADPVSSFPKLAADYLPAGLLGYFWITLFAVVMSTVESYMFLAAVTGGRDLWLGFRKRDAEAEVKYTKRALFPVALLAVVLALYFRSVVELWYIVGSVTTPALLLPVLTTFYDRHRFRPNAALLNIVLAGGVALSWELLRLGGYNSWVLAVPGIYVGLGVSLAIWLWGRQSQPVLANLERITTT